MKLSCLIFMFLALAANSATAEEPSTLLHKQALRQLTMEHVDCAMFYLSSSICSKVNTSVASQSKRAFEIMMSRAYRLAAESDTTNQVVTLHGKIMLEEMNKEIGGDCSKLVRLEGRYQMCKGLAEDFTSRGREIMQNLVVGD